MINWLLFFPEQQRWVTILSLSLCGFISILSLICGIFMKAESDSCGIPLGVYQIGNAICIITFCLVDLWIHTIPHYAKLQRKVVACLVYTVTIVLLFISGMVPTVFLENTRTCSSIPSFVLGIETVALSFSFVYISIHLVLFIYHCHVRSQLRTMNIEEMRNHLIDPSILPEIFSIESLRQSHSEIRVSDWIPQYRVFVKQKHKEGKKSILKILNTQDILVNRKQDEDEDEVDLTCAICMCELEPDEYIYNLSCKHPFHISCLEQWYRRKDICPLCKSHIDVVVTAEDTYSFDRSAYEERMDINAETPFIHSENNSSTIIEMGSL